MNVDNVPGFNTMADLFNGAVSVQLTTETVRGLLIQAVIPEGILCLETLSEKTLRFFPWSAVKQISRKLKK